MTVVTSLNHGVYDVCTRQTDIEDNSGQDVQLEGVRPKCQNIIRQVTHDTCRSIPASIALELCVCMCM